MSYFALLDSDEENDKPVPKIAVKKETKTDSKDAKATAAAPAKTAAAPVKADGKPQAGKEQPKDAAKKDVKKPKGIVYIH